MKVLFIRASDIYNESRATKEISAIAENNNISVIGWDRHGGALSKTKEIFRDVEKIEINFFHGKVDGEIGLSNVFLLIGWRNYLLKKLNEIKPDVVHACDLIVGGCVMNYCRRKKIKVIYDMYDHYADSHILPKLLNYFFCRIEDKMVSNAYATIICSEERRDQIANAKPKEVLVIHNSPDVSDYDESCDMNISSDYIYCGALNGGRLIEEILELYPNNSDLKFVIAGHGVFDTDAMKLDQQYENMNFLGSVPYNTVLEKESASRVLSAIYDPILKNNRLCAPNKFYEAMALKKPVIVCENTGIDKIVEREKIGVVIPYDANEFYKALRFLLNNPKKCLEMGKRGRKLYEQYYTWAIMKEKLKILYKKIESCEE